MTTMVKKNSLRGQTCTEKCLIKSDSYFWNHIIYFNTSKNDYPIRRLRFKRGNLLVMEGYMKKKYMVFEISSYVKA